MEYLVGGGGVLVAAGALVLLWYVTRDIRDMARKLGAAQRLAIKAEAALADCERTLNITKMEYERTIAGRARTIKVLRTQLAEADRLLDSCSSDDVSLARLRRVLQGAIATTAGDPN